MQWFKFLFLEMQRQMPHGEKRRRGLMSGLRRYFWRQAEANDRVPFHQVSSEVSISFFRLFSNIILKFSATVCIEHEACAESFSCGLTSYFGPFP